MTKKICLVLPWHWSDIAGGSEYQAQLLIDRLLEAYDVEIVYLTLGTDAGVMPKGYEIRKFSRRRWIHRYGHFFDARRLYKALAAAAPDLVLQMVGCAYTGIAAFYAKRCGATFVWRVTSDRSVHPEAFSCLRPHLRIEKSFLEYGIRRADLILAQTEQQRLELERHYGRGDAVVVRNFHPVPTQFGFKDPKRLVVWIANLKPLKNPHAFVRLAKALSARNDASFVMIGGIHAPSAWSKELLESITTVPNLRYLGAVSQDEVNAVLDRASVLVNTSDYEGFSNTFVQAWLRRVPVVSLKVDPDGLLSRAALGVVAGSEEGLRRELERLLDRPILLETMGEQCRAYAASHCSLANIDEMARLLQLAQRARARGGRADSVACGVAS
ncbi:MAG TPA: glycosyltransferase family 4 protein [Gammaproteobacteria bacterium]|nr:glycosyltransferase family 4 protein [Gammaproteobacteria bacterium]